MSTEVTSAKLVETLQVEVVATEEKYAWILAVQTALNPKENHGLKAVGVELVGSRFKSSGSGHKRLYLFSFELAK